VVGVLTNHRQTTKYNQPLFICFFALNLIMSRIVSLQEFLKESPNDCFLQHALALEYIKLGDDKKAVEIFVALLAYDENYYGSYYHLAKLYERINEIDKAITTYEKGITITTKLNEKHALGELRSAYEELTF
jgi:Tfp pilus assembly protein PilF